MKIRLMSMIAVAALSTACVYVDGSPGGDRTTRTSSPDDFDQVAINGGFDHVEIQVCGDCEPRVKISGDDRQVDEVIIAVDDGELGLDHRSRIVVTDIDLDAEIRVRNLRGVVNSGSADITITGIATEEFDLVNSGSGDVTLEGITGELDGTLSGSGGVSAYDLEASVVDLTLSGSGDAEVCAKQSIHARTTGSGDVFYDCDPDDTDFNSTGSGRISIR